MLHSVLSAISILKNKNENSFPIKNVKFTILEDKVITQTIVRNIEWITKK